MGLGTILAQMINVVTQPILTRVFSVEILGIYTYLISIATIIIPVTTLKLDMLIVSEPNDCEAQYITDTCIIINFIIFILYITIILIGYILPGNNMFNRYGKIIFIVPFIVFTNGLRFLFISYLNRYQKYRIISIIAVIRETIRALIQVGTGLFSFGIFFLVLGYTCSPLFGLNIQMREYLEKLKKRPRININKFKKIIFEKGKKQILFLVPGQFINSLSSSIIIISITTLFSEKELGYYSTGVMILEIPIIFITSNVSKVCYQKFSENVGNNKPIYKILTIVMIILSVVSLLGFGILWFIAPNFAGIIFGEGYEVAGTYIKYLCVMYAVRLVATSFSGICTLFKKQEFELFINILLVIVAVLSYIVCNIFSYGILDYLKFINIGYTIVYMLLLLNYIVICRNYDKKIGDRNEFIQK